MQHLPVGLRMYPLHASLRRGRMSVDLRERNMQFGLRGLQHLSGRLWMHALYAKLRAGYARHLPGGVRRWYVRSGLRNL